MAEAVGYGGTQDRGRRPYQEDAFHIQPPPGPEGGPGSLLLLLADGMGGHRGGAHASAAAIEAFVEAYRAAPTGSGPEAERLRRGLAAANERIARDAGADPALRGMGCTVLGASLTPAGLCWISVGDSPLFLFRGGALSRLNADHSMAPVLEQAVQLGTLGPEALACHPNRNALRSAVTGRDISLVDLRDEPMELRPGDRLVAASDGILTLAPERIEDLIEKHSDRTAEGLSRALVEAVGEAGNPHQDNVTVLIAAVPPAAPAGARDAGPARPGAAARLPQRLLRPRALAAVGGLCLVAALAVGAHSYGLLPRLPWPPWASEAPAPTASESAASASPAADAAPAGADVSGADSGKPPRPAEQQQQQQQQPVVGGGGNG